MSEPGSDHGPHHFIFGNPEEVQAQLRAQFEMMNLANEASIQQQDAFLEGLTEEQLRFVRGFLDTSLKDPDFGHYMMGWLSALLKQKFKVCQYCGKKHEDADAFLAAHTPTPPSDPQLPFPEGDARDFAD